MGWARRTLQVGKNWLGFHIKHLRIMSPWDLFVLSFSQSVSSFIHSINGCYIRYIGRYQSVSLQTENRESGANYPPEGMLAS